MFARARLFLLAFVLASPSAATPAAGPQSPSPQPDRHTAILSGSVTAMGGEVLLPGAFLLVREQATGRVVEAMSDERGRFRVAGLPPGEYRVAASLAGFRDVAREVRLTAGQGTEVVLDLPLAGVSETVTVVPQVSLELGASLGSTGIVDVGQLQAAPVSEFSLERLLPLVPGVIRGPDGISIKGGRPSQSSLLVGGADVTDPATGEAEFRFPGDAAGRIEVLPNPYAVEFGRFSSGVTLVQPRRGAGAWRLGLGSLNPAFRTKRDHPLTLIGVESFSPRASVGGPLVPERLFLAQSFQYRYASRDIRSRPQSERIRREGFGSFTRLDAKPRLDHHLATSLGLFPEKRRYATLGTFEPPEAAASTRHAVLTAIVADEWSMTPTTMLDTTLHVKRSDMRVRGEGDRPLQLLPEGRSGNFFNDLDRDAWAVQWRQVASGVSEGRTGQHFYKGGVDLLWSGVDGASTSRPVEIRRGDLTLARRVTFEGPGAIRARGTDAAVFVQDRWQPNARVLVEGGLRLDRDGVARETTLSPRVGARVSLAGQGRITISGGVGRFVERLPLGAAAFERLQARVVTTYAADGVGPTGVTRLAPAIDPSGLSAPRALTWHLDFDQYLTPSLSVRVDYLERQGTNELIVEPAAEGPAGRLTLHSGGRSRYRELAVGGKYDLAGRLTVDLSYVRSRARGDLNSYSSIFGTIANPWVRPNASGPAAVDVPNRVVGQLRGQAGSWRAAGVLEWRDGLPFSAVDALQDYVGSPNRAGRLPDVVLLDVSLERRVRVWKLRPYVGLQLFNALNHFNPRDVQGNVDSPFYGSFYNSDPRRLRVTLKF